MSENLILKQSYKTGKKLKEDKIGILYEGHVLKNELAISIREYRHQFCHPSLVERLQGAILSLADLHHPNIVRIIDSFYAEDGRFFIFYDTPYEGSLAEILIKLERFTEKQTLSMLNTLGKAVDHAHQQQIWHGAINPENIDILADGQIKLRNFYIDDLLNSFVLAQGRNVLNPSYLAPEQLRGEATTKTTDVLALGVLGYQLLSGRKPYPEITGISMLLKNYQKPPERLTLRNSELPKYLEDIITKAMQYKQNYRHQSVLELLGDFRNKKVTVSVEELRRREAQALETAKQQNNDLENIYSHDNIGQPGSEQIFVNRSAQDQAYSPKPVRYPGSMETKYMAAQNNKTPGKTPLPPENELNPIPPLSPKKLTILYYVLFGLICGIVLLIIHALFVSYFDAIPKVEVPNVVGLKLDEAESKLDESGLRAKVVGYITDDTVSPDSIVTTTPETGRVVKKQRIIKLFVSKGSGDLVIPDLLERDVKSVEPIVKDKGFDLVVTSRVYSNKYPRNQIISQKPAANESAKKGSTIEVSVSNGYPVSLKVVDQNTKSAILRLSVGNEPTWEPQNVFVYIQDSGGRHKHFEKLLAPGERKELEIVTESDAIVEVYFFNDLAYKQELKYLTEVSANAVVQ